MKTKAVHEDQKPALRESLVLVVKIVMTMVHSLLGLFHGEVVGLPRSTTRWMRSVRRESLLGAGE